MVLWAAAEELVGDEAFLEGVAASELWADLGGGKVDKTVDSHSVPMHRQVAMQLA